MFEAANKEKLIQERNLAILKRSGTIIHTCRRCKKKIPTYWENDQLVGEFMADDVDFSDALGIVVAYPDGIICLGCFYGISKFHWCQSMVLL